MIRRGNFMESNVTDERDELTDGWPDEAGNAELAEFGRRLRKSRPELGDEAMARIRTAMSERARRLPARPIWRMLWKPAIAAMLLLGAGIWVEHGNRARVANNSLPTPAAAPRVHDQYVVSSTALPSAKLPSEPLLRMDDYRGLIGQAP